MQKNQFFFSRKDFAQNKTTPHQAKMKIVKERNKGFYLWNWKTLMKKAPKNNMKMHNFTTKKN
jgi:hypothetical protein